MRLKTLSVFAAAIAAVCMLPQSMFAASCESLQSLSLPHTAITAAVSMAAGTFGAGGRGGPGAGGAAATTPAVCRVEATLRPVADSEIKIMVALPSTGWNGKLETIGNGAWAGSINAGSMASA